MLPQLVPIAPVMNTDMRNIDLARLLNAGPGAATNFLYLKSPNAAYTSVKNLVTVGKARRKKVM